MRKIFSAALTLCVWVAASKSTRAVVQYDVINLGTLKAGDYNQANGVNDSGQAVGYSSLNASNGPVSAFLYSAGSITGIPTLGGLYNTATAINTNGQVGGYSLTANGSEHAFLYTAGSDVVDAGVLASAGTSGNSYAYGLNDSGTLVGSTQVNPTSTFHVFTFNSTTGLVDLGTLPGGSNAYGYSINNSGDIAGESDASYSHFRAFDYTPAGGMTDIGTLGGAYASARGINNLNEVVGSAETATDGFNYHAYAWTAAGGMIDLGVLGGIDSSASAVNDHGVVIGTAHLNNGTHHAFVYNTNGVTSDLNSLISPSSGWTLSSANGIANSGDIVGYGTITGTTYTSAFELVPTARLLGDANLDGHVDLNDLNIVLNNLGLVSSAWTDGNFDDATTIDLNDLNDVLNNLGVSSTPSTAIAESEMLLNSTLAPEPASLCLLGISGIVIVGRRPRRLFHEKKHG